jgi:hypothetical protein
MKRFLIAVVMMAAVSWALAAPTFTYVRNCDGANPANTGNTMAVCARASGGGIVFTDGFADYLFRVKYPLTCTGVDGPNDFLEACVASFTTRRATGLCWDGLNYYTSGVDNTSCSLYRISDSGTDVANSWTVTPITISPNANYSGCSAVGANSLIMADYDTGALQFFTISGTTATPDGSAIANTNVGTYKTTQVFYYDAGAVKKIFAYMVQDGTLMTRRVDVFNTDGTRAGTTYAGTFCNGVASTWGTYLVDSVRGLRCSQVGADPQTKVLVAAICTDQATAASNGFDVFDISASIPTNGSATPIQQLRGSQFNNAAGSNKICTGSAFYTDSSDSKRYATLGAANQIAVYRLDPGAGVNDWALY